MIELSMDDINDVTGGIRMAEAVLVGMIGNFLYDGAKAYASYLADAGSRGRDYSMSSFQEALNGGNLGA